MEKKQQQLYQYIQIVTCHFEWSNLRQVFRQQHKIVHEVWNQNRAILHLSHSFWHFICIKLPLFTPFRVFGLLCGIKAFECKLNARAHILSSKHTHIRVKILTFIPWMRLTTLKGRRARNARKARKVFTLYEWSWNATVAKDTCNRQKGKDISTSSSPSLSLTSSCNSKQDTLDETSGWFGQPCGPGSSTLTRAKVKLHTLVTRTWNMSVAWDCHGSGNRVDESEMEKDLVHEMVHQGR